MYALLIDYLNTNFSIYEYPQATSTLCTVTVYTGIINAALETPLILGVRIIVLTCGLR